MCAQWLPSDDLFACSVCVWDAAEPNLRGTVAGEQPGFNVCRCIPNWGIAFLVIAISICALTILAVSFQALCYFSQAFLFLSRALRDTRRVCRFLPPHCLSFPPIFSLSLTHIDSPLEHVGVSTHSVVACEKLAESKEYIMIITPNWYLLGKVRHKHAQMHRHVQVCTVPKH